LLGKAGIAVILRVFSAGSEVVKVGFGHFEKKKNVQKKLFFLKKNGLLGIVR
jgi:hypothetical protein